MPRTRQQTRSELENVGGENAHQNLKRVSGVDVGPKPPKIAKRSAFGDITNALTQVTINSGKKAAKAVKAKSRKVEERELSTDTSESPANDAPQLMPSSVAGSQSSSSDSSPDLFPHHSKERTLLDTYEDPCPEVDYDGENLDDVFSVPHYAAEIFMYYKMREEKFRIGDYMSRQTGLNPEMRAVLVDWLVEIQENFELNHETLYQAVKLTDMYLDQVQVSKANIQLVGSAALFIACKFDERMPPCADDFLYICDDAYDQGQLFQMEMNILRTVDFDIGMPLSYRFLRRYARANKMQMDLLTLARYILETSLMYYEYVSESESLMAAAALLLAMEMKKVGDWTPVLVKYSGYRKEQLEALKRRLNRMLLRPPPADNIETVHNKYSHEVFHEVAKVPPLPDEEVSAV